MKTCDSTVSCRLSRVLGDFVIKHVVCRLCFISMVVTGNNFIWNSWYRAILQASMLLATDPLISIKGKFVGPWSRVWRPYYIIKYDHSIGSHCRSTKAPFEFWPKSWGIALHQMGSWWQLKMAKCTCDVKIAGVQVTYKRVYWRSMAELWGRVRGLERAEDISWMENTRGQKRSGCYSVECDNHRAKSQIRDTEAFWWESGGYQLDG